MNRSRPAFFYLLLIVLCFGDVEKEIQMQLILAEPGDTIRLEAGLFPILGTLSMEG